MPIIVTYSWETSRSCYTKMKCWSRGVPRAERVLEQFKLQVTPKHQELQGGQNKLAHILYALTLPNINRFSKLFHYQNQEKKL